MASLSFSPPTATRYVISSCLFHNPSSSRQVSASCQVPRPINRYNFHRTCLKNLPLLCTKSLPWETSPAYVPASDGASIIKGSNVIESFDADDSVELADVKNENDVIELKKGSSMQHQPLKWPMWFLGPLVLLVTGMAPTLWLPLSSVFLGPNMAGLLSLVGLDCIFNLGATLFLLMADACARAKSTSPTRNCQVPLAYRFWNMGASMVGFIVPLAMLFGSCRGLLEPHLSFISFSVLLGPYLLLLSIQMLTEILTWHWKSPVWLVTPVVYEAYRVLQLMRGLRLGTEVGAPAWAVGSIRGLVSWWVLILGIQLMRVAWFTGYAARTHEQQ